MNSPGHFFPSSRSPSVRAGLRRSFFLPVSFKEGGWHSTSLYPHQARSLQPQSTTLWQLLLFICSSVHHTRSTRTLTQWGKGRLLVGQLERRFQGVAWGVWPLSPADPVHHSLQVDRVPGRRWRVWAKSRWLFSGLQGDCLLPASVFSVFGKYGFGCESGSGFWAQPPKRYLKGKEES